MWQTKRSLLNALTHALTFPVNLEGRQGVHLCCGGRARAAETVFIITPRKPCQKPRAVWPPAAAACGREITINNEKSESQKAWNVLGPFLSGCAASRVSLWILYTYGHLDFCDLRGEILETLWPEKVIHSPAHSQVDGWDQWASQKNSYSTCLQSWFD